MSISSRLINSINNFFKSWLQGDTLINPNAVDEGQAGPTKRSTVGKYESDELGGKEIDLFYGLGLEKS